MLAALAGLPISRMLFSIRRTAREQSNHVESEMAPPALSAAVVVAAPTHRHLVPGLMQVWNRRVPNGCPLSRARGGDMTGNLPTIVASRGHFTSRGPALPEDDNTAQEAYAPTPPPASQPLGTPPKLGMPFSLAAPSTSKATACAADVTGNEDAEASSRWIASAVSPEVEPALFLQMLLLLATPSISTANSACAADIAGAEDSGAFSSCVACAKLSIEPCKISSRAPSFRLRSSPFS